MFDLEFTFKEKLYLFFVCFPLTCIFSAYLYIKNVIFKRNKNNNTL